MVSSECSGLASLPKNTSYKPKEELELLKGDRLPELLER